MGVLNVTPDSFSDGGAFADVEAAIAHGRRLAAEGAAIVDVGGESTRPGARPVSAEHELARVLPVIEGSPPTASPVSIDTSKADVAQAALAAGAVLVNDVTALRGDPEMAAVVAEAGADSASCTCSASRARCRTTRATTTSWPRSRASWPSAPRPRSRPACPRERIVLDPGIGFGKTLAHNLELLRALPRLARLGPLLLGVSRKRFLGALTGREIAADRVAASVAAALYCYRGGARLLRVHDVRATADALAVERALEGAA